MAWHNHCVLGGMLVREYTKNMLLWMIWLHLLCPKKTIQYYLLVIKKKSFRLNSNIEIMALVRCSNFYFYCYIIIKRILFLPVNCLLTWHLKKIHHTPSWQNNKCHSLPRILLFFAFCGIMTSLPVSSTSLVMTSFVSSSTSTVKICGLLF